MHSSTAGDSQRQEGACTFIVYAYVGARGVHRTIVVVQCDASR